MAPCVACNWRRKRATRCSYWFGPCPRPGNPLQPPCDLRCTRCLRGFTCILSNAVAVSVSILSIFHFIRMHPAGTFIPGALLIPILLLLPSPAMRTWIAVHLLHPTLDTLCPDWRNTAAVVIDHGLVRVCSPAAREAGVQPGMRSSGVNTLCPQAVLTEYDEHVHHSAIQAASLALLQYTPELALGERDTLLLDVTASLRLFGGIRRLYRRIQGTLQGLCLSAGCAIATTAGGAWLLATCTCARLRRCLKPGTQVRRLDVLPVGSLPAAHPYEAWLGSI